MTTDTEGDTDNLSPNNAEVFDLCQRIMLARAEVAFLEAQEKTVKGDDRRELSARRVETCEETEHAMMRLGQCQPDSLHALCRMLEVVVDVLMHRFVDPDSWLAGGEIERIAVVVMEALTWAADVEGRAKRDGTVVKEVAPVA